MIGLGLLLTLALGVMARRCRSAGRSSWSISMVQPAGRRLPWILPTDLFRLHPAAQIFAQPHLSNPATRSRILRAPPGRRSASWFRLHQRRSGTRSPDVLRPSSPRTSTRAWSHSRARLVRWRRLAVSTAPSLPRCRRETPANIVDHTSVYLIGPDGNVHRTFRERRSVDDVWSPRCNAMWSRRRSAAASGVLGEGLVGRGKGGDGRH